MEDEARAERERFSALTGAHSAPETPMQESRALLEQGRLPEAEQIMREYLAVHKSSADAHFLLGYILFKKKMRKRHWLNIRKARSIASQQPPSWRWWRAITCC